MRIGAEARALGDGLRLWPPLLATTGPGGASSMHAHHAMHLVIAKTGTLRVRHGDEAARSAAAIFTAPDVPHALDASGVDIVLVFVDPESDAEWRAPLDGGGFHIRKTRSKESLEETHRLTDVEYAQTESVAESSGAMLVRAIRRADGLPVLLKVLLDGGAQPLRRLLKERDIGRNPRSLDDPAPDRPGDDRGPAGVGLGGLHRPSARTRARSAAGRRGSPT